MPWRRRPDPYPLLRRAMRGLGYHLVRADAYSPIVDPEALRPEVWDTPAAMPGVDLREEAALRWLEEELRPSLEEFARLLRGGSTPRGYHAGNPMYPPADAAVLFAALRTLGPGKVVEVGAGWSTLAAAEALSGQQVEHVVIDPVPPPILDAIRGEIDLRAASGHAVTAADLAAGDVLLIDTTHTLRPGGEVPYLLLEVVPAISPGVVVCIHDFFRPYEYPRELYERHGVHWQEHYLVQGLLVEAGFEVLCAVHALARRHPERLARLVPAHVPGAHQPSALWLRRVTGPADVSSRAA